MAYKQGSVSNLSNLTDNAIVRGDGGAAGVQTSTAIISDSGQMTNPSQSAFLAYLATTALNKTGTGTTYTLGTDALTEVYDQGSNFNTNGFFTAPVTGKYILSSQIYITGSTVATGYIFIINTSNRVSVTRFGKNPASSADNSVTLTLETDMDASDQAYVTIAVSGEAGDTDDIAGSSQLLSYFSGALLC